MLNVLQNKHWQVGILPQTGASIAFARMRYAGTWVDLLRPTASEDYGNPSKCSSFLMLPWANRIRDGLLRFGDQQFQLQVASDHTARHGDVRGRAWHVLSTSDTSITLALNSADCEAFNFPFALSVQLTYTLDGASFVWHVSLKNEDSRPFPAGFGHHPYFMIHPGMTLQIPCNRHFELENALASAPSVVLPAALDFRQPRAVSAYMGLEHLLTGRTGSDPISIHYPDWRTTLRIHADPAFQHVLIFSAPDGTLAIEPQTNANDGFNLFHRGIPGSGVFVVESKHTINAAVRLELQANSIEFTTGKE